MALPNIKAIDDYIKWFLSAESSPFGVKCFLAYEFDILCEVEKMSALSKEELELWKLYQNEVSSPLSEKTYAEIEEYIQQCENTIFEAKAKQSKAIAIKRERDAAAAKMSRDQLISNPNYKVPEAPSNLKSPAAYAKEKKEKKEKKAKASLFSQEDLAEMMKAIKEKKNG